MVRQDQQTHPDARRVRLGSHRPLPPPRRALLRLAHRSRRNLQHVRRRPGPQLHHPRDLPPRVRVPPRGRVPQRPILHGLVGTVCQPLDDRLGLLRGHHPCFPPELPLRREDVQLLGERGDGYSADAQWVITVGVLLLSLIWYVLGGRKYYDGPRANLDTPSQVEEKAHSDVKV